MIEGKGRITIWFFIGVLLLAYGILITASGAWEFSHPPEHPVVLADLHATFWWGLFLLAIGLFYSIRFRPGRDS
jgi:hypothetical protein